MNSVQCEICGKLIEADSAIRIDNMNMCKLCATVKSYGGTPETVKKELTHILDETREILKERGKDYGNPADTCEAIASYWTTYLQVNQKDELSAKDVAMMMILFKIVREQCNHKHDNLADVIGYAAIADYIQEL